MMRVLGEAQWLYRRLWLDGASITKRVNEWLILCNLLVVTKLSGASKSSSTSLAV